MRAAAGILGASLIGLLVLAGCGGTSSSQSKQTQAPTQSRQTRSTTTARSFKPRPRPVPRVLGAVTARGATPFVPAVRLGGATAAWIARSRAGVALISFDQKYVRLALHSGTIDAGGAGWKFGPSIGGRERHLAVAAFNGGFKFSTGAGGFVLGGRPGVPLRHGLGSIVTYANGMTDVGTWGKTVPASGQRVASVRQNLTLLVDHGRVAGTAGCLLCWGATLGGVLDPARSALGITADRRLVWVGGEHLTVAGLGRALLSARVVRAVELDINPEWVAAYLYRHRAHHLQPVPVLPDQPGVPGKFLAPYQRDFFAVLARA
jgi:hypothetical protein